MHVCMRVCAGYHMPTDVRMYTHTIIKRSNQSPAYNVLHHSPSRACLIVTFATCKTVHDPANVHTLYFTKCQEHVKISMHLCPR
jgi:hypothetical protein